MSRQPSVFITKLGAARRVSASSPQNSWVSYLPENPTVGSIVYPASASRDHVRTVFARESNQPIQNVRACRNAKYRENFVKK